uniref:RNA polymerase II subunit A C-terminal domain phosphatase n=1 Tax=Syphacia muris TaxID=451379 RepID=A0A0N5AM47_9BILA
MSLVHDPVNVCFKCDNCEFLEWKVSDGAFVKPGTVLLTYKNSFGEELPLSSDLTGVVSIALGVRKNKVYNSGDVVATINECNHAIVMKDMCGTCGKDLRGKDGRAGERIVPTTANISMIHHVPELVVSNELAQKIGSRDREVVLKGKKLVLLVDLDQTLIHTTNSFHLEKVPDVIYYKLRGIDFYTKLRPHTREFLKQVSNLFEMHIISYGERQYAHRIAEILDPEKIYFGHRILSRDELLSAFHKTHNLNLLFPCGDQLITIIDDRPDVWEYSEALIQVKPYRYFKEIGDINAPLRLREDMGSDTIEELSVTDAEDKTLEYLAKILTKIHRSFYEQYDEKSEVLDVKKVISCLRRQVLKDCSIVLSGIVPIGVDPKRTEAFRLCVQFGATVTDSITEGTTHVIAARWGTSKVHEALKRGNVAIVNPKWLYACVERWEKADEAKYELERETMNVAEKPLGGTVIVGDFSIGALDQKTLRCMSDEVDEALSEEGSEDEKEKEEETSVSSIEAKSVQGKRKSLEDESVDEKRRKTGSAEEFSEKRCDNESDGSTSNGSDSGSDFDDMVADVERQLLG